MKIERKTDEGKSLPFFQNISSAEMWKIIERNLGKKLIPVNLDILEQNTKKK